MRTGSLGHSLVLYNFLVLVTGRRICARIQTSSAILISFTSGLVRYARGGCAAQR